VHPSVKDWDNYWQVMILGDDCTDTGPYGYAPQDSNNDPLGYFVINKDATVNERTWTDGGTTYEMGHPMWSVDEFEEVLMHHEHGHALNLDHPGETCDLMTGVCSLDYDGLWMNPGQYNIWPTYDVDPYTNYAQSDWAKITFQYLHA
jgi:hypothetical protein